MTGAHVVFRDRTVTEPVVAYEDIAVDPVEISDSVQYMTTQAPDAAAFLDAFRVERPEVASSEGPVERLETYLEKMENFEAEHYEDVYLEQARFGELVSVFRRMDRVQNLVGHGNFNVLAFDDMLKYASRYESVGAFPAKETEFLESMFAGQAERYGFFGEKVIDSITARVPEKDSVKVGQTGHFLFRGDSLALYRKLRLEVGEGIVLTSGIRSVVKQTHLFLAKTIQSKGNLSRASRSLAPPGHSFHGIGDFDVGKVGLGARNFTTEFARTNEFRRLVDLGFVDMRYPQRNLLGVRYEPWHIKVV